MIRAALVKMGEYVSTGPEGPGGRRASRQTVRSIRVTRSDPRTVAEAVAQIWPRVRRNPIVVVTRGKRIGDVDAPQPRQTSPPTKDASPQSPTEPGGSRVGRGAAAAR